MEKRHQLIALLVLLGLVMVACAPTAVPVAQVPAEEAGAAEAASTEGPSGEVVWWALAEFNFEPFLPELEKAYEEHSPNVDLQVEILPEGAYLERLLPTLASGTGPDIVVLEFVPRLSRPTALLDVMPYVEGPDGVDLSQWNEDSMFNSLIDGSLYGLPRDVWGDTGWFINKDLFDQAGVPYPGLDWTWADLEAIAPDLTDKENRIYGVALGGTLNYGLFGVQYVSDDLRTVVGYMDSPEAIAAYKTYRTLYECCSPTLDQQATEFQDVAGGGMGPMGALVSGRTAIAGVDPGVHEVLTEAGLNWGYVPAPLANDPENRHMPPVRYVHWAINKNSQNPDAAWDFLKWLTGKDEGQMIMARAGYFVPFRESLEAANYPQEIVDVRFRELPQEWKDPIPAPWGLACFGEAAQPEVENITQAVLTSPMEQVEEIVREGTLRAQEALDACWEKQEAGG